SAFEQKLALARTVFPYVENHNFYVEHWAHSMIWRRMRDLGGALVHAGFINDAEDVFMFKRNELSDVLGDMYHVWAVGVPARGASYWPKEIARRQRIMDALEEWAAPPALGIPPEVVTEPFTVMLWGITDESVSGWLH